MVTFFPTLQEFKQLAKQGNLIPVYTEIPADTETPVSVYMKIAQKVSHSFLLESVEQGEFLGRYSFIGTHPLEVITLHKDVLHFQQDGKTERVPHEGKPLDALRAFMRRHRSVPAFGLPSFYGGAVGYLAYEAAQFFERIPVNNSDPLELPLGIFMVARDLFIFDHVKHAIQVVSNVQAKGNLADAYHAACRRVKAMAERLNTVVPKTQPASARSRTLRFASNTTRSAFLDKVKKAKAYIRAGDIIQIQISQRLRAKSGLDPFLAYRALRVVNPSPYMFFLNFPQSRLIGSSPEMLIRCAEGKVETRPIAGTVLRGEDTQQDRAQEKRLLADPKERAEHIMLVDLARHELGRVCKPGTVKVPELMVIERYSHVMHIVSQVEGALLPGKDHFDALRSAFPAGTVTGAPKIRAMEIIDELEHEQRGPYAGAVGHIDFAGNLDLAITIRTMVHRAGEYYLQAAAGVVADSKPEKEYQETLNKMQALRKALELAHAGWVK